MHPHMVVTFVVAIVVAGGLGFAFRGKIGKEIGIFGKDAVNFAVRLEVAAAAGGAKLEQEARAVAGEIRKLLSEAAAKL